MIIIDLIEVNKKMSLYFHLNHILSVLKKTCFYYKKVGNIFLNDCAKNKRHIEFTKIGRKHLMQIFVTRSKKMNE